MEETIALLRRLARDQDDDDDIRLTRLARLLEASAIATLEELADVLGVDS